jgi:acyl carrier protein
VISDRLQSTIRHHLKLADLDLTEATTADEVPGWDSLSHIEVIAAVEEEFGVRFKALEVIRLKNIGELQALVDKKTART